MADGISHADQGPEQADATDFVCVNPIIADPRWQCVAVSPVDIRELKDLLSDEELELFRGYMDRSFHACVSQREGKRKPVGRWTPMSLVPMTGIPS